MTRSPLAALLLTAGCASSVPARTDGGGPPLFFDIQYTEAHEGLVPLARDMCGIVDGEYCPEVQNALTGRCDVDPYPTFQELSFAVTATPRAGLPFGLAIDDLGRGADTCRVTVTDEDGATYEGACSEAPPTPEVPCRYGAVLWYDDIGNPTIEADFECRGLDAGRLDLHGPGTDDAARATPGHLRIANCTQR